MANRKRKCRYCSPDKYDRPENMVIINNAAFCNMEEAIKYANENQDKARKKLKAAERKENRKAVKQIKDYDKSHQEYLTQIECNKLARLLDAGEVCISCGEPKKLEAGHFRSVGSTLELRYCLLNIWGQCRPCNQAGTRKMNRGKNPVTVAKEYEKRLRAKIGDKAVDWLQGPHPIPHRTIEDLKALRFEFIAEQKYIKEHGKPSRNWRELPAECETTENSVIC